MKKFHIILMIFLMSLGLSACSFSEHGALFEDEERMLPRGIPIHF